MPEERFDVLVAVEHVVNLHRSFFFDGIEKLLRSGAKSSRRRTQQEDSITQRLDVLYSRHPAQVDSGLHPAQLASLAQNSNKDHSTKANFKKDDW